MSIYDQIGFTSRRSKRIDLSKIKLISWGDKRAMRDSYARYMEILQGPPFEIRPHGGVGVPKKSVKFAVNKSEVSEAAGEPAGGSGASSDDEGGDGDGDSDGPRQSSQQQVSSLSTFLSAARRLKIPTPFIHRVCTWMAALALLFPYYQLGLSAFLAERGHAELASEVLRFKPIVLVQLRDPVPRK